MGELGVCELEDVAAAVVAAWAEFWAGFCAGAASDSLTSRLMRGPSMPSAAGVGDWVRTMPGGPGAGT